MHKRITSAEKQALRQQLRREANGSRPAFSEALHHRILSAIEQDRLGGAVVPVCPVSLNVNGRQECLPHRDKARWPARLAACAAACLLGVAALGWQIARRENLTNVEATDVILPDGLTQLADPWLEATGVRDMMLFSPIDELAGIPAENFDGLLSSSAAEPMSSDLEHGAHQTAEALLRLLPVDVEMLAGP